MKRLKSIQEKMMNIEDWGKMIPLKDNRNLWMWNRSKVMKQNEHSNVSSKLSEIKELKLYIERALIVYWEYGLNKHQNIFW